MSKTTVSAGEQDRSGSEPPYGADARSQPDGRLSDTHRIPPDPMIGVLIDGRYRIERELGAGGVGVVYEATHLGLGHLVAIKLLRDGGIDSPIARGRFEREAKLLSEMSHPNVVSLSDYGVHEDMPYLVMERLRGRSLDERLAEGLLPPAEALFIARAVASALAFAHERNVLHRDLKPANIFLQETEGGEENPKLLDFGLAKLFADEDESEDFEPTLTKAGSVVGTPAYMPPEQASASRLGPPADIYAFGCVLFELLAGQPPFHADRRTDLMRQHMMEEPPAPELYRPELELGPEIRQLLVRCLEKRAMDRFASGSELCRALDALPMPAATVSGAKADTSRSIRRRTLRSEPPPPLWERHRWSIVSTLIIAVVALVAAAYEHGRSSEVEAAQAAATPLDDAPSNTAEEDTREESEPPDSLQSERSEAVAPVEPVAVEAAEEPEGQDPFEAALPPELAAFAERLVSSDELDRDAHRDVRIYQRLHPEDPRPTLMLAHDFSERSSWTEAVERYELALRRWPEARYDARMADDLIEALTRDEDGAAELLVATFGAEMVPVLELRLAESEHRPTRQALRRALDLALAAD